MRSPIHTWMVIGLLLSTTAYAIAEEMTLTTYYPSPRGVYRQARIGSGNALAPGAALEVTNNGGGHSLQVDTAFVVAQNGNVGIGTINPGSTLDVVGNGVISGNLGIGTTTPTEKLHVIGNGIITGTLNVTGNATFTSATVTGTLTANTVNTTILIVPGGSPGMVLSYDPGTGNAVWDYPKYAP